MNAEREEALALARDLAATPANLNRVTRATSPEAARWAFSQWDLRRRARTKFARADEMLFVREALEQATHERVAAYHASLFPVGEPVIDMTTGIGADLVTLAARGPTLGYELDPERADCARWNLGVYGVEGEVVVGDSLEALTSLPPAPSLVSSREGGLETIQPLSQETREGIGYAFADPARRVEGRRTLDLSEFSPDPRRIADRFATMRLGVQKLTPLLKDDLLLSLGPRVEFVSFGGECREALVFAGAEASEGVWAVQVESGERLPRGVAPTHVSDPGAYFFDADPAAVRAHALGALAQHHTLTGLGDSNGYLTGEGSVSTLWLRGYRTLAHGAWDLKRVRSILRDLRASTPILKQRGAGLELEGLRKSLRSDGDRPVVLAIYPVGRGLRYAVGEG